MGEPAAAEGEANAPVSEKIPAKIAIHRLGNENMGLDIESGDKTFGSERYMR